MFFPRRVSHADPPSQQPRGVGWLTPYSPFSGSRLTDHGARHKAPCSLYSALSASLGATRVVRSAGIRLASAATPNSVAATSP